MSDKRTAKKVDVLSDEALSVEQRIEGLYMLRDDGNEEIKAELPRWREYLDMLYRSIGEKIVESKRIKNQDKCLKAFGKNHRFE